MAFGFKNKTQATPAAAVSLNELIKGKSLSLRDTELAQSFAQEEYLNAAQAAANKSKEAGRQAAAVEKALAVLDEAGVVL